MFVWMLSICVPCSLIAVIIFWYDRKSDATRGVIDSVQLVSSRTTTPSGLSTRPLRPSAV